MKFDLDKLCFIEQSTEKDKLAIVASDKNLSWQQLYQEVEKYIIKLERLKLPLAHPVVIYGHKESLFIVAIIACMVLKLPYTPIDIIYPQPRLQGIMEQLKSAVLINTVTEKIIVDHNNFATSYQIKDTLVYIIFTSGSTGYPKGVQITKSSLLDFRHWLESNFKINHENIFMNQAPFSFDLSVFEVIGFLCFGGTIILNSRKVCQNHQSLITRLQKYQCNTWVSTPSFIRSFLMSKLFNSFDLPSLKTFIFCGEVFNTITANKILRKFSDAILWNCYGPTEATVATTAIKITTDIITRFPTSLPIANMEDIKSNTIIELLEVDIHNIGEICVSGANVSIGYFGKELKNTDNFFFRHKMKAFMTGDLGYIEDKMLFVKGRTDDMIKLHGFRIEPQEINRIIFDITGNEDVITIPMKRGVQVIQLITFIVTKKINIVDVKNKISQKLPYYMIPADIVCVKSFPKTENYKIDKKKLIYDYISSFPKKT